MEKGKLTPQEWAMIEVEEVHPEDLEATSEFYDKIVAVGEDFYKGKKLMPGQE